MVMESLIWSFMVYKILCGLFWLCMVFYGHTQLCTIFVLVIFKLQRGALAPKPVCLSLCPSVLHKLQKKYKPLQNLTNPYKPLKYDKISGFQPKNSFMKPAKEAWAV